MKRQNLTREEVNKILVRLDELTGFKPEMSSKPIDVKMYTNAMLIIKQQFPLKKYAFLTEVLSWPLQENTPRMSDLCAIRSDILNDSIDGAHGKLYKKM